MRYSPNARKFRVELGRHCNCLGILPKNNRRARGKQPVRVRHELGRGWPYGNDQIRLAILILTEIPRSKLVLRSLIRKEACLQMFNIQLNLIRRLFQSREYSFVYRANGGRPWPDLIENKDSPDFLLKGLYLRLSRTLKGRKDSEHQVTHGDEPRRGKLDA